MIKCPLQVKNLKYMVLFKSRRAHFLYESPTPPPPWKIRWPVLKRCSLISKFLQLKLLWISTWAEVTLKGRALRGPVVFNQEKVKIECSVISDRAECQLPDAFKKASGSKHSPLYQRMLLLAEVIEFLKSWKYR